MEGYTIHLHHNQAHCSELSTEVTLCTSVCVGEISVLLLVHCEAHNMSFNQHFDILTRPYFQIINETLQRGLEMTPSTPKQSVVERKENERKKI